MEDLQEKSLDMVSTRYTALTPGFDYSAYARNRIFTGGIKLIF